MKLLTWALSALLSFVGATAPSKGVHVGVPPAELWGAKKSRWIMEISDYRGVVEYDTTGKEINLQWRRMDPTLGYSVPVGVQTIALSYWPTEVLRVAPNRLYVAGKRTGGATLIEEFSFGPPRQSIDTQGQVLVHAPVLGIESIYDEKTVGRDLIAVMFSNRWSDTKLLVQFWDSKDVYSLDTESGDCALAYSKLPGAGVPHASELGLPIGRSFGGWDHIEKGFLYGLHYPRSKALGVLLLIDANRDGTLDSSRHLTGSQWEDLDLSNSGDYAN